MQISLTTCAAWFRSNADLLLESTAASGFLPKSLNPHQCGPRPNDEGACVRKPLPMRPPALRTRQISSLIEALSSLGRGAPPKQERSANDALLIDRLTLMRSIPKNDDEGPMTKVTAWCDPPKMGESQIGKKGNPLRFSVQEKRSRVTYICFAPKGALTAGDPDPSFSVSFRARIK